MSDSAPPSPATPKRKRRWLRRLSWTFIGLIAALAAVRLVWGWVEENRFESRIDALRKAGEPVTFADFPLADVPFDQNAMPLYEEAFVRLALLPPETLNPSPVFDNETGEEKKVELHAVPEDARDIVRLLHEAAGKPGCRPILDLRACRPFEDVLANPFIAKALRTHQLLRLSARENLAAGRVDEAGDDVVTMFRLGRAAGADPNSFSLLCRLALTGYSVRELQAVMDAGEPSPDMLARLLAALDENHDDHLIVETFRGERCFYLMYARMILDDPNRLARTMGWRESRWRAIRSFAFRPLFVSQAIGHLGIFNRWVALSQKPWHETGLHREKNTMDLDITEPPWYQPLGSGEDQSLYACAVAFHRFIASIDCARLGIELRRNRTRNGTYPNSLDALIPSLLPTLPIDPFSGKPYLYRRVGKGFIVYSVGCNGIDDGGIEAPGDPNKGDIVWKCSR